MFWVRGHRQQQGLYEGTVVLLWKTQDQFISGGDFFFCAPIAQSIGFAALHSTSFDGFEYAIIKILQRRDQLQSICAR